MNKRCMQSIVHQHWSEADGGAAIVGLICTLVHPYSSDLHIKLHSHAVCVCETIKLEGARVSRNLYTSHGLKYSTGLSEQSVLKISHSFLLVWQNIKFNACFNRNSASCCVIHCKLQGEIMEIRQYPNQFCTNIIPCSQLYT